MPPKLIDLTTHTGFRSAVVVHGQGYFPVLDRMPDGRAVVMLRGGGGHINVNGRLDLLYSDDGLRWYGKRTAIDTCADDRNPAFGVTPSGRLLLGFHLQAGYTGEGQWRGKWGLSFDLQTYSDDEGLEWSPFENLRVGDIVSTSPYGRIIRLADGSYLQNVYGRPSAAVPGTSLADGESWGCAYVVRSRDEGVTWGEPALIATEHNETALLEVAPNRLLAASRSEGEQHVDLYRSEDGGRCWTHVVQATGKHQHPADLIDLGDGAVLMIFGNRHDEAKDIRGILSRDGGATWDTETHLRLTTPVSGDFGYPSAVRVGDDLVIVHYWAGDPETYYDGTRAQCRATLVPMEALLTAV